MENRTKSEKKLDRIAGKIVVSAQVSVDFSTEEAEIASFCASRGLTWSSDGLGFDTKWTLAYGDIASATIIPYGEHVNDLNYHWEYSVGEESYDSLSEALIGAGNDIFDSHAMYESKAKVAKEKIKSKYFNKVMFWSDYGGACIKLFNKEDEKNDNEDRKEIDISVDYDTSKIFWSIHTYAEGDYEISEFFNTFEEAIDDLASKIGGLEIKYGLNK